MSAPFRPRPGHDRPSLPRFAAVQVSSHIIAQGPVMAELPDGRLVVSAGGPLVAGRPIARA